MGDGHPSLVILLPMVWSVRNVIYSGILRRLTENGVCVHLLTYQADLPAQIAAEFALAASYESMQPPILRPRFRNKPTAQTWVAWLLTHIIRRAYHQRNHNASYPIYRAWLERHDSIKRRILSQAEEVIGALAQPEFIFKRLLRWEEALYRQMHDLTPFQEQLRRLKPDLVWSTVCISPSEYPYILAAHDLSIPIVTSILSFDNLTSRTAIPDFDHYWVWSDAMRDQLLQYYRHIAPEQVAVTGTPQFDFHRKPEAIWPRPNTLNRLGLPEDARYFLYAASAAVLTPQEPELVTQIAARMARDEQLKTHWLVVRVHPVDSRQRWQAVLDQSPRVVLSAPWDTSAGSGGAAISTLDDQYRLVSSIYHANACINIASTTTLDAAILDRPSIGIEFSNEPDSPRDILYREYETTHYKPLVASGGLRVAHTWAELLEIMRIALEKPERDRAERANMVAQECGLVDGHAAERVTDAILGLLGVA